MTKRCPFCATFDRSDRESEVQSLREMAVHIVYAHAEEFHELAETVSDEWAGRFAPKYPQPSAEVERRPREALEAIIVRCTEGDPAVDWRPTIEGIARAALAESDR